MQDIDKGRVIPGNRFVFQDAFEFTLEGSLVIEILTPDHFHGAQRARHTASHPYFAVSTTTDFSQDIVIGYARITAYRRWHDSLRFLFKFCQLFLENRTHAVFCQINLCHAYIELFLNLFRIPLTNHVIVKNLILLWRNLCLHTG